MMNTISILDVKSAALRKFGFFPYWNVSFDGIYDVEHVLSCKSKK